MCLVDSGTNNGLGISRTLALLCTLVTNFIQFSIEFSAPIDITDAAARVCDPIFQALNGTPPVFGLFLKDYTDTQW